MKTRLIALLSLLFVFGVFIWSCDEAGLLPDPEETSTTSAEDNAAAELAVSSVFEGVNSFGIDEDGKKNTSTDDPVVTWNDEHTTVTLDYGEGGTVVAAFNGENSTTNPDLEAAITVTNFVSGGYVMSGAFTLAIAQVMDTLDGNNQGPAFSIIITDDLIFNADTASMTWSGNRHVEWIEGFRTDEYPSEDDVF